MTAFLNPLSPHIQICRITVSIMTLRFNSDGSFRVLQLADIQDGPNVRKDTIRLIEAAIHEAHPDLIVFTGDQIRGYDPAYIDTFLRRRDEKPGTHVRAVTEFEAKLRGIKRHPLSKALLNTQPTDDNWTIDGIGTDSPKLVRRNGNGTKSKLESWAQSINSATMDALIEEARQKVRDTFAAFLGPALEARIPFAATYGNHDFQCGVLADDQDDIYREFSGCMNPVAGSSPLALEPGTFALPIEASDGSGRIAMSVMMVNSGDYAEQPANDANNAAPNAVEGARKFAGHCYVLDHDLCRPGSRLGEAIGCADDNVGEVQALREAGGYFALFCGHDHKNAFVGHVHDLDLGYAPTCGFESYGPKSRLRGIRLFEFNERNPQGYVTRMLTWGDLVGRYSSNEVRVFFEDHCVTDLIGIRNELRRPQVFATLIGVGSMGLAALAHATLKLFRR